MVLWFACFVKRAKYASRHFLSQELIKSWLFEALQGGYNFAREFTVIFAKKLKISVIRVIRVICG